MSAESDRADAAIVTAEHYQRYRFARQTNPAGLFSVDALPCKCDRRIEVLSAEIGPSDSVIRRVRCTACGHAWHEFIEG